MIKFYSNLTLLLSSSLPLSSSSQSLVNPFGPLTSSRAYTPWPPYCLSPSSILSSEVDTAWFTVIQVIIYLALSLLASAYSLLGHLHLSRFNLFNQKMYTYTFALI